MSSSLSCANSSSVSSRCVTSVDLGIRLAKPTVIRQHLCHDSNNWRQTKINGRKRPESVNFRHTAVTSSLAPSRLPIIRPRHWNALHKKAVLSQGKLLPGATAPKIRDYCKKVQRRFTSMITWLKYEEYYGRLIETFEWTLEEWTYRQDLCFQDIHRLYQDGHTLSIDKGFKCYRQTRVG